MKKYIYLIFFFVVMNACSQNNSQEYALTGKILIREIPSGQGKNYIYENNVRNKLELPNSSEKEYSELRWLNKEDSFIGVENIQLHYKTTHSNLVLLDTFGNVIKDVITTQKGQYIGAPYVSPNDSLLLFITEVESENQSRLDLFKRPVTINVINFKTQALVKQIPNVCDNIKFDIQESPWSYDENSFVYSVVNDREIIEKGKPIPIKLQSKDGVYIYDLKKGSHKKISEKGRCAVWSPKGEIIAFISDNKVWLHGVETGKNELLYEAEKNEQLKVIHWTPDGEYLFVVCPKYYGNNFNMKHNEKLIEIKGKREVDFVKPNIGLNNFSWK
jgi:hypothetical protein